MSDNQPAGSQYDRNHSQPALVHAVKKMPLWKWRLLGISLLLGLIGAGGQVAYTMMGHPTPHLPQTAVQTSTVQTPASPAAGYHPPAGGSGFVGAAPTDTSVPLQTTTTTITQSTPAPSADQSLTEKMTPYMTSVGLSLFVGVIVGVIFRTFVKTAAIIIGLLGGVAFLLGHYGIVNIDMSAVQDKTADLGNWIHAQADILKTALFARLPSSTAAGAGFFFGFKRR